MKCGARLLPAVCSSQSPPGERRIFDLLRQDPGAKTWIVLHSLDLVRHVAKLQGEADFVIIIPGEGVVVLEVKSHNFVKYDERGWWLGSEVQPDPRGPFKQAAQAMHSIREYLHDKGVRTQELPFISAVAFTGISFDQKSPEWHPWQVLDLQILNALPISEALRRIVHEARSHFSSKGLFWGKRNTSPTEEISNAIAQLLRPRFECLANPAQVLKAMHSDLLKCTEQQFRFLDNAADNPRLLVHGLAGTGKTTLALEALRREKVNNPPSRAALFCYNRFLGDKLRSDCAAAMADFRVGSFHQWMVEFTGFKPSHSQAEDPEFWNRRLPEKVLDMLTDASAAGGILDFLVLDEAQDLFRETYLDIFDLLLKGGLATGRWLFFGDFVHQDIYVHGAIPLSSFRTTRAPSGATFRLDINCRNTLEISCTLTAMAKLQPGYSSILRGDSRRDPELVFYDSQEMQAAKVSDALNALLALGFRLEEIALLSPSAKRPAALALSRLPQWRGRIAPYPAGPSRISYCSIHAFKGLEAPAVILTDIDDVETRVSLNLLYIGMSRALHHLYMFAKSSECEAMRNALV